MRSQIRNNTYRIMRLDDRLPVELNKEQTDESIEKIKTAIHAINEEIKNLYHENYDLLSFLDSEVFEPASLNVDDGKIWNLNYAEYVLDEIQDSLKSNDDNIPEIDDVLTLEDDGFRKMDYGRHDLWEKVLESNNEKEVVEEILLFEKPIRRIRTIFWEIHPGVKSSKEIKYEELEIDEKLLKHINNTKREYGIK